MQLLAITCSSLVQHLRVPFFPPCFLCAAPEPRRTSPQRWNHNLSGRAQKPVSFRWGPEGQDHVMMNPRSKRSRIRVLVSGIVADDEEVDFTATAANYYVEIYSS